MKIRKIEARDQETVLAMMVVFYASEAVHVKAPVEVLSRNISDCLSDLPYVEGFVFEDGDEVIGYSMVAKSYTTEYGGVCICVEDIYLKPEHQGKGYVSELFRYLEKCYEGEAVRYRIEVEIENEHAVRSYEKNGYEVLDYLQMTKVRFGHENK